jgi:hypothetical protein
LTATGPGQITGVAQDTQLQVKSLPASVLVSVEPPTIINFAAVHIADNTWTVQGDVEDVAPGDLPVVFGGPGNVQGSSVNTDSSGHFTLTVMVSTTAPSFTITAMVTDSWGLQSDQVSTICSNG